jgi:hypothetical protein
LAAEVQGRECCEGQVPRGRVVGGSRLTEIVRDEMLKVRGRVPEEMEVLKLRGSAGSG